MTPKMPRMLGAKMTSRLMVVRSRMAMAMCLGHQNVLLGKKSCWMARLTCATHKGKALHR